MEIPPPRVLPLRLMKFRDLAPPGRDGPPRALRALGFVAMATVLVSTLFTEPRPGFDGDGPLVILGIVLLAGGLFLSARRIEWFPGARFVGLAAVGIASLLFAAVQPDGAGYAGVYFVMAIGGIRLDRDAAIIVCGGTVVGLVAIQLVEGTQPGGDRRDAVLGPAVVPGHAPDPPARAERRGAARVARRARRVRRAGRAQPRRARAARRARRTRSPRSRCSSRARGCWRRKSDADPEVIEGLERAHHLAVSGLSEARQAISALRGDDLPALEDLAGTFPGTTFTVSGTPREPSSEARLALYRTAQEALTNVRRHSASDRVELRLVYEDDGTTLTVQDHGARRP